MTIIEMSLASAALIAVAVLLRALLLDALPKRTFIALWSLALCRLLLPFSLPSRISVFSAFGALQSAFHRAAASVGTAVNSAATAGAQDTAASSSSLLTVIWLAGIGVPAAFFLVSYLRCRREFRTALPVESAFVDVWLKERRSLRRISVRYLDKIGTPLTYGLVRPVILLPKETLCGSETQLGHILTHEAVHIRRFDNLLKLLAAAAVCIHWFNPFVWVMYILLSRDIELACDEAVVRVLGSEAKSHYAMTLIGMAENRSNAVPLFSNFCKNPIKERITSIMNIKKTTFSVAALAFLLVAAAGTTFLTTASAKSAPTPDAVNTPVLSSGVTAGVPGPDTNGNQVYTNSYGVSADGTLITGQRISLDQIKTVPVGEGTLNITADSLHVIG